MSKPICGNNICENNEYQTCPSDCDFPIEESNCGDGICEGAETKTNCPYDCGTNIPVCGDGVCEYPETIECSDCKIVQWVLDYKQDMVNNGIPNNYLQATEDFDYYSENIQEMVNRIREDAYSAEDAVKRTVREVYIKVDYVILSGEDCMVTSASEVLERGFGLCSTMSKVNIAVLRGMGIAARPVTGCLSINNFCRPLSILGTNLPKQNEIRMEDGKGITGGGLHAWVEVWLPNKGWVLVESTNGMVYQNTLCVKYDIKELNPTQMSNFCWISGNDYINSCKDESLFT